MIVRRFIQAGLLLILFPVVGWANDGLHIKDPWVRMAPPGSPMAGYFVLMNHSSSVVELVGAEASEFGDTMIHQTRMEGELMKMEHVDAVEIKTGEQQAFKPGGYHLLFMKPKNSLQAGDNVTVTLKFSDGSSKDIEFSVKSIEESMEMDHTDHSGHGSSEDHSKHGTNE